VPSDQEDVVRLDMGYTPEDFVRRLPDLADVAYDAAHAQFEHVEEDGRRWSLRLTDPRRRKIALLRLPVVDAELTFQALRAGRDQFLHVALSRAFSSRGRLMSARLPANDNAGEGTPVAGMLDRINRVQVTAELLGAVLHSQIGMLPQDRSPEERGMLRLLQLLMSAGFRPCELGMLATAIEFRLTALANVASKSVLLTSSVPRDAASPAVITRDVLQAAADVALIEDADGQPAFDESDFKRRLLAASETDGSA
jgi:hypothetical protein